MSSAFTFTYAIETHDFNKTLNIIQNIKFHRLNLAITSVEYKY